MRYCRIVFDNKMPSIRSVHTAKAATPSGHYSQATIHGDLAFVSGILPIEPDGSHNSTCPFSDQANCVLRNATVILQAAGCGFSDVVKTTVYVTDIASWAEFDSVYAEFFGDHRPARAVVPVPVLHHGFSIEMELIASVPNK